MNSCKVFVVNEALSRDDVTFAAKPKAHLRAVPYGATTKQIVRINNIEQDIFSIFDAGTSILADITGMALFLTIFKGSDVFAVVKGKVNSDIKGMVSFKLDELPAGFYSYEVTVRANNYSQSLLSGSYVTKNS
jgi:hypothetical protein